MRYFLSMAVIGAFAITATPAIAQKNTTCEKAFSARAAVIKKHGKRAPGRNICRYGVKHSNGVVLKANDGQKNRYLAQLRRLVRPVPYLAVAAGKPSQDPGGTLSPRYAPSGLAQCIVNSESGGNPQANNGSHFGIAQWTIEAWLRHGGGQFASSPLGATYDQQLQVLSNGLAKYGCRDWCPFDPC